MSSEMKMQKSALTVNLIPVQPNAVIFFFWGGGGGGEYNLILAVDFKKAP